MGNKPGHINKAQHNNNFLNTFIMERTKYLDWAVVGIFYTALHYVDAYLATKGFIKINNHQQRNRLVEEYLPAIS